MRYTQRLPMRVIMARTRDPFRNSYDRAESLKNPNIMPIPVLMKDQILNCTL